MVGHTNAVRVLITAIGSRGDVAPYAGLVCRIRDADHPVAIAAHRQFAGMVREHGLEFREIRGELHDLLPQLAEDPITRADASRRVALVRGAPAISREIDTSPEGRASISREIARPQVPDQVSPS
ncbi:glycosyltransferase [Saccharopolyspora hattusasensis]|uniref:glycosyltransferase n=1 Tax=Saccharopolyspora hattusasensis TaxID=1128679 RepID=UPI003D999AEC